MRRLIAWTLLVALTLSACTGLGATSATPTPAGSATADRSAGRSPALPVAVPGGEPLRLVTLGDSYTAGTNLPVPRRDSWPAQLVEVMTGDLQLRLVANVAEPSSTSGFVLEDQLWGLEAHRPDVVTLLVGANDIIAPDVSLEDYRRNVGRILDQLLTLLPPQAIFTISTPDFTLTRPAGDRGDRLRMAAEVDEANAILDEESRARGIRMIDISPVSDRVPVDPSLVIDDGLYFHPEGDFLPLYPSPKQYAAWVEVIGPTMRAVLVGDDP